MHQCKHSSDRSLRPTQILSSKKKVSEVFDWIRTVRAHCRGIIFVYISPLAQCVFKITFEIDVKSVKLVAWSYVISILHQITTSKLSRYVLSIWMRSKKILEAKRIASIKPSVYWYL